MSVDRSTQAVVAVLLVIALLSLIIVRLEREFAADLERRIEVYGTANPGQDSTSRALIERAGNQMHVE